jgi:hypothetical protein
LGQVRRPVNAIIGKTRAPPIITTHFNWPELQPTATNCQPGQGKKISKSGFLLGYYTKRSGPARRLEMFHRPVQSARIFRAAGMFDVGCFPHFSFSACQYFSIQLCVSAFQHFRSLLFRF